MNGKGCGRKRLWCNMNVLPAFAWVDGGKALWLWSVWGPVFEPRTCSARARCSGVTSRSVDYWALQAAQCYCVCTATWWKIRRKHGATVRARRLLLESRCALCVVQIEFPAPCLLVSYFLHVIFRRTRKTDATSVYSCRDVCPSVRSYGTEPLPPDEFLCFRFLRNLAHRFRFYLNVVTCVLLFTLFCIICTVFFVLFRLCIFILVCFVCTSVRTIATEWQLNCS